MIKKLSELFLKFFDLSKKESKLETPSKPAMGIDPYDQDSEGRSMGSEAILDEPPVGKGRVIFGVEKNQVNYEEVFPKVHLDIESEDEVEPEEFREGKFELKKNVKGNYHFNLLAGNFKVVLTSEVYNSKQSALKGIASVKANAQRLKAFDMRLSKNGKDYFVLKAKNGRIIGVSEMYESNQMMLKGIKSVKKNAPNAPIYEMNKDGYTKLK